MKGHIRWKLSWAFICIQLCWEKKLSSYLSLKKKNNINLLTSAFFDTIGFAYGKKDKNDRMS